MYIYIYIYIYIPICELLEWEIYQDILMSLNFLKFHYHLFYSKREGSVFAGIHCASFLAHGNSQTPCIRFSTRHST